MPEHDRRRRKAHGPCAWAGSTAAPGATIQPCAPSSTSSSRRCAQGWILGENYLIEFRFARNDSSAYPALADDLLAWHADVLYGLETASRVLVTKTRRIPIVLATSFDPVAAGLAKSLARPGSNVTGMVGMTDQLTTKQIRGAGHAATRRRRGKGLLEVLAVVHDADVQVAFARIASEHIDALVVAPSPGTFRLGHVSARRSNSKVCRLSDHRICTATA